MQQNMFELDDRLGDPLASIEMVVACWHFMLIIEIVRWEVCVFRARANRAKAAKGQGYG